MMNLTFRNWRLYIRDRAAVLYSLLAVFIVIGLYLLFLGDNMVRWMGDYPGGRHVVDSWIMAGLIGVTSFTTTLGALGTIVEDRDRRVSKDFRASPLKRWQIAGGYLLSSVLVGFFMCVMVLILAEVYIVAKGGTLLTPLGILQMLGIILLSVVTSATLLFPIVFSVKSMNAYSGISTVAGTLIGFLTGMYIPIGELPAAVGTVMKCFPITHSVALMRKVMLNVPLASATAGAPAQVSAEIQTFLGMTLRFGDTAVTPLAHVLVLLGTIAVFFGVSVAVITNIDR